MRVFVAIELPPAIATALAAVQHEHHPRCPGVRWSPTRNIHLTLRFLGEIDEARVPAAINATRAAASHHAPIALALAHAGVFPHARAARILWAGVGGDVPALTALACALETALQDAGFGPAEKPFAPHITLGRIPPPVRLAPAVDGTVLLADIHIPPLTFVAHELVVMQSTLDPRGAIYTRLGTAPFTPR